MYYMATQKKHRIKRGFSNQQRSIQYFQSLADNRGWQRNATILDDNPLTRLRQNHLDEFQFLRSAPGTLSKNPLPGSEY